MKKKFRTWLAVTEHFGEDIPQLSLVYQEVESEKNRGMNLTHELT